MIYVHICRSKFQNQHLTTFSVQIWNKVLVGIKSSFSPRSRWKPKCSTRLAPSASRLILQVNITTNKRWLFRRGKKTFDERSTKQRFVQVFVRRGRSSRAHFSTSPKDSSLQGDLWVDVRFRFHVTHTFRRNDIAYDVSVPQQTNLSKIHTYFIYIGLVLRRLKYQFAFNTLSATFHVSPSSGTDEETINIRFIFLSLGKIQHFVRISESLWRWWDPAVVRCSAACSRIL